MPFAAGLRETLDIRGSQVLSEFSRGDTLERVLTRHLRAVEDNFDGELITSILVLGPDGKRLFHAAGPKLPNSYRDAIDGSEIGPRAGSCGTAAYLGEPVYVSDIATDPLWKDYRHLALPHGLRSCWSTPIRDPDGAVLGTFATYHREAAVPTRAEIEAIELITDAVAEAIIWSLGIQDLQPFQASPESALPKLRLVSENASLLDADRLLNSLARLESLAMKLDRQADVSTSEESSSALRIAADDSRRLIRLIRLQIAQAQGLKEA